MRPQALLAFPAAPTIAKSCLQAGADTVWANDHDTRHANVITRNVGAQLQDQEPQLATPLPGLRTPVLELSAPGQQQRAGASSHARDVAAAHFIDRAAPDSAFSYMERELGEVGHSSGDRPECDQSPASLFYGPSDAEVPEECELPPNLWRQRPDTQRAFVTHADGAHRSGQLHLWGPRCALDCAKCRVAIHLQALPIWMPFCMCSFGSHCSEFARVACVRATGLHSREPTANQTLFAPIAHIAYES